MATMRGGSNSSEERKGKNSGLLPAVSRAGRYIQYPRKIGSPAGDGRGDALTTPLQGGVVGEVLVSEFVVRGCPLNH